MFRLKYTVALILLMTAPLIVLAQFELFENLIESPNIVEGDDFPLDLVWEAGTHVPAEYEGKALPSSGSIVVVSALTPTRSSSGLEYKWRVEDVSGATRIEHSSLSKNQFAFKTNDKISNFNHLIFVSVADLASGQKADDTVSIPVHDTETVVKASSPTGALLEPAVSSITLPSGSSLQLLARTFFFPVESKNVSYEWIFDGKRVSGGLNTEQLDINVSSGSGDATKNLFLEVFLPGGRFKSSSHIKIEIE